MNSNYIRYVHNYSFVKACLIHFVKAKLRVNYNKLYFLHFVKACLIHEIDVVRMIFDHIGSVA